MVYVLLSGSVFFSIILLIIAQDFTHNKLEKHGIVRESANISYTEVINFWNEHKDEVILHDDNKNVILIIGHTGSENTTLIFALFSPKLRSMQLNEYLVIVDEQDRVGRNTSNRSFISEVMTDTKRNVTYIDFLGIRNNQNIEYEISFTYFRNILVNHAKEMKLFLVINYDSLKINGNNDLDDLFEHTGEFFKNIPKIHDGIALVVTNNNNTLNLLNNDQLILEEIDNYLRNKKKSYLIKTNNIEKYRMYADLIDVLLERHGNLYTRIVIFRQPISQRLLDNLPKTKNEINAIANMTINNLRFVKIGKKDFNFALSQSLKSIIDNIVDDILQGTLTNYLQKMNNETLTHYLHILEEYSDIEILRHQVSYAYDVFSQLKNIKKPETLFKKFFDAANILNISLSQTSLNISQDIKKLTFFSRLSNSHKNLHMLLKNNIKKIIDSIRDLKNFYNFLDNLQTNLAAYMSQNLKNDKRIASIIISCTSSKSLYVRNIRNLKSIVNKIGGRKIYEKIRTIRLHQFQLQHLKSVFSAYLTKLEFSCTSLSNLLTVKGYNVKMSELIKINCFPQARIIQIFALNKIFIDCSLNKTGAEAQLIIIASTWEVVGRPEIFLNGVRGKLHIKKSAKSSPFNIENGSNGLPGLPGGSAGHFFGAGKRFINLGYLKIHANGGIGGPGQHGGNGADGIPGGALSESFFKVKRKFDKMKNYFEVNNYTYDMELIDTINGPTYLHYTYLFNVFGKHATKPSDGGDGGSGGYGGYPGNIVINSLGKLINAITSNHSGSTGPQGRGGYGGKKTSEGRKVTFCYQYITSPWNTLWSSNYDEITWTNGIEIPSGKNGTSGSNHNNQKPPTITSTINLWHSINSFNNFLELNLSKNIKESELKSFMYELKNDNLIKTYHDEKTK